MSENQTRHSGQDRVSAHPQVARVSRPAAVTATFFVNGTQFDLDGNPGTQVDIAEIVVGDAVAWQWYEGIHTVTNGAGTGDPGSGTLFDQPSDLNNQYFQFTFNNTGTFPFFCGYHEAFNMRGVVEVRSVVGAGPSDGVALGFTTGPAPNPSQGFIRFRFALREPGRVRAEILDVRGRRIAVVLTRGSTPGRTPQPGTAMTTAGHCRRQACTTCGFEFLA